METIKQIIQHYLDQRQKYIDYYEGVDELIDKNAKVIIKTLSKHHSSLNCDFMLETLDKLGFAPSLISNDDGRWAVLVEGIQNMNAHEEPIDMIIECFIDKGYWKNNIRDAIIYFLEKISEK
jgi:hypothetical protein